MGRYRDERLPQDAVAPAIVKGERVAAHDGTIVRTVLRTRHAAHLEDVNKVAVKAQLGDEIHGREVEVVERHAVGEHVVRQQLLAADVQRVFGQVERFAQRDVPGGELDARGKRFFRARGEHDGAMAADAQLEMAEKARVVVEEADIGRTGRRDVARHGGGEKRFAVNQGEVVDLARLERLERDPRLDVGRGDLDQLVFWNCRQRAHAMAWRGISCTAWCVALAW